MTYQLLDKALKALEDVSSNSDYNEQRKLRDEITTYLENADSSAVAWTWDTEGTGGVMKGYYEAHFQFTKPEQDKRMLNLRPLFDAPPEWKSINLCGQVNSGSACDMIRAKDERVCPDCNPDQR